jgi:hypothetical protein
MLTITVPVLVMIALRPAALDIHACAQVLAVGRAENLAEAWGLSSLLQGASLAKTRAFSRRAPV